MSGKSTKSRMIHLDLLRVFAAFSVVMLHSAAQFWYTLDMSSTEWLIANTYDALFRFGVPVFVMLSGALFLAPDYEMNVKRLYKHNILRLAIIYSVWSVVYGLLDCFTKYDIRQMGLKQILREIISGRYHLWYIPMLVGIYVTLPILRSWLEHAKKSTVQYFLILFIVLQVGEETLRALIFTDEIHAILDLIKVDMLSGYLGYFVLGYYLAHIGIGPKLKRALYIGVIPAMLANTVLGYFWTRRLGTQVTPIYDCFGMFTFVVATALFVFALDKWKEKKLSDRSSKWIEELSACTLGVYLLHVGLMEITLQCGFHSMILPNIIGIPVYAICSFTACTLIAWILRRLPFVGRYIC